MIHIVQGDARALPFRDGIAQTCVTSPPYWGLRDYGTARWEGGDAACDHLAPRAGGIGDASHINGGDRDKVASLKQYRGKCLKCGAVRVDDQIGMERTPDEYVANIVAVMREVWRVLRDDGTLWLNLGDSYASAWVCNRRSTIGNGSMADGKRDNRPNRLVGGLKEKDLVGVPWRVAFALQADGWYLRSDIIWSKPAPMPESVTDRPTKAHEYVFLLAKQPRYYYDAEAIAEKKAPATVTDARGNANGHRRDRGYVGAASNGGTNLGGVDGARNARSVWTITPSPYGDAHFATMPLDLARRCVLAGSRPGDVVLDPFMGSGTTAKVAIEHGRRAIGVDLNESYHGLISKRTTTTVGML